MADKRAARRGSALLAVLWLSAALGAIAFALATTVRGELERTSTAVDGARAYYLAEGGLERAMLYMQWGSRFRMPDGAPRYFSSDTTWLRFGFPSGDAVVQIASESAKLNVNSVAPEELFRLLEALGAPPGQADTVIRAVVEWRTAGPERSLAELGQQFLPPDPSFRARRSSFQEIEELLLVPGMTTDLFYGSLERDPAGRLAPRGGLVDCLTTYASSGSVDVNTAPPAVLAAMGLGPQGVGAILQARQARPFRSLDELRALGLAGDLIGRLGVGGAAAMYTLRSTARLRLPDGKLSDLERSLGATVTFRGSAQGAGGQILRWRDRIWVRDTPWTQEPSLP